MIYDSVDNFKNELPAVIPGLAALAPLLSALGRMSFDELKAADFSPLDLRFGEYETRPQAEVPFEAHRKLWDVQLVIEGEEYIGCAPLADVVEATPYSEADDIAFYSGAGQNVLLRPGMAVLLAPWDAHRPGVTAGDAPSKIKKIVVKLKGLE